MQISLKRIEKTLKEAKDIPPVQWIQIPPAREGQIPRRIIENFKFKNDIFGDMFVTSTKDESCIDCFKTVIKNCLGKPLGEELYSINSKNGNMFGLNITVNGEYRQKKAFRFGEVLRLASVMEMVENMSSHLKILSKNTAVYFHSKYKFIPDVTKPETMDKLLKDILADTSPEFKALKKEAENLMKEISENSNNDEVMPYLTNKFNNVLRQYIEVALKSKNPQKEHPLSQSVDMILTRKAVAENKDFFNRLFKKHGINYAL